MITVRLMPAENPDMKSAELDIEEYDNWRKAALVLFLANYAKRTDWTGSTPGTRFNRGLYHVQFTRRVPGESHAVATSNTYVVHIYE